MELEDLRSKLTGVRVRNNPTDNSVHSIAHELHARCVFGVHMCRVLSVLGRALSRQISKC